MLMHLIQNGFFLFSSVVKERGNGGKEELSTERIVGSCIVCPCVFSPLSLSLVLN